MSKARGLADLGNVYSDGALSNRNLIINGAMQVAQRGTSVTGLEVGQGRTCDRIGTYVNTGTWTVTQETDAPDGFGNSFKVLATAVESFGTTGQVQIFYTIEGRDLQGVAKGTPSAKEMVFSFYCKANKTGTHAIAFRDQDNSRVCTKYFTVNSTDTWEYKTIVLPADTTGAFDNDNNGSLQIEMWMNGGSNFKTGTPTGTWEVFDNAIRLGDGHTATIGDSVNDYFQITGIQLEVGDTATPFEHRSYGQELALCQRYFQWNPCGAASFSGGSNQAAGGVALPVALRATPTITVVDGTSAIDELYVSRRDLTSTLAIYDDSPSFVPKTSYSVFGSCSAGATANTAAIFMAGHWTLDAEL